MGTITSKELDDDAKEAALQQSAKRLFTLFFILMIGAAVALFVPIGILWVFDYFGMISLDAVIELTLSLDFIIAGTVVGIIGMVVASKLGRKAA